MSPKPAPCVEITDDLVATATGEADATATGRALAHADRCAACREDLARYRAIDRATARLRNEALPAEVLAGTRARLEARLSDFRTRLVAYGVFASPLGPILIARSEQGVALVEWVRGAAARPRRAGEEVLEAPGEVEPLYRDLAEYLAGRRTALAWPLDFRAARSEFQRAVLRAASGLPYGAVTSYARIARLLGQPRATRAVAQALRRNPLPIVVPCHRVVGASGALTGYAGRRVDLKHRLLAMEGVRVARRRGDLRVERRAMYARAGEDSAYCLPTCSSLAHRSLADLTLFATSAGAEAIGLAPCTICRPDLHPLPGA